MRVISVVNQKGGCGKTTVSINLASSLSGLGHKTLLIDMDPQSHCSVGLAVPEEQIEQSIYDVLISLSGDEPLRISEVLWQISDGFELAPSSIDLAAFEQQTSGIAERENCLKYALEQVKDSYDYVVIDCAPSVGLLTFNAIMACDDVIVPAEMGYFSLHGLQKQLDTLNVLSKRCPKGLNVKVLASMYDVRTKMGREILGELRKHFAEHMFKTIINFNTKLKEAASLGQPICEYDPSSKGNSDFKAFAEELAGSASMERNAEIVESLNSKLEAISASADELMSSIEPETAGDVLKKSFDEKVSEFYGVRQINDAIVFVSLYPRAQKVQLAGDFNNWQPENTSMEKVGENGKWQIKLPLASGKYRYRLVVDGKWQHDPYNEAVETNPFGEYNSILQVH